jgi:hypothetical protein
VSPIQSRSVAKRSERPTASLGRHLEKNLLAYVAAASAALLPSALPAEAEIIYTPSNTPMAIAHANRGPVYTTLDLNNDGVPDFTFAISSTLHFSSYGYTTRAKFFLKVNPYQKSNRAVQGQVPLTASAVPAGVRIGPQEKFGAGDLYMQHNTFDWSVGKSSGTWQKVEFAYLGVKFMINGQVHYGWARIKFPYAGAIYYPSIYGYAYESTPNQPITAGQTSGSDHSSTAEPASLGRLAAGAIGLNQWRGPNLK